MKQKRVLFGVMCLWMMMMSCSKDSSNSTASPTPPQVKFFRIPNEATSISFFPILKPGLALAVGFMDGAVRLYQNGRLASVLKENGTAVKTVEFSPNGERLVSGSENGEISIWRTEGWILEKTFVLPSRELYSLAFSANGEMIACLRPGGATLLNARSWDIKQDIEAPAGAKGKIALSPDGKVLIIGASPGGGLLLKDTADQHIIRNYSGYVNSLAISQDGSKIACDCSQVPILIKNKETSAIEAGELRVIEMRSLLANPRLIRGPGIGEMEQVYGRSFVAEDPLSIAFSPDGSKLVSSFSDLISLWEMSKPTPRFQGERRSKDFGEEITSIAFAPDNRTVAIGGRYGKVALWDPESGAMKKDISAVKKVD